ncbi:hypothetical protein [Azotosporobacter soli]|uniref:hypothetical protein n=1 Tax=Azotosporobacter soli TaxID=3055040 RepID=UPI0031FEF867
MMNKLMDLAGTFLLTGLFVALANWIGYKIDWASSLVGVAVIIGLGLIGAILSQLPVLKRLPMVFWVSIVAVIASLPVFPGSAWIIDVTKKVQFLAIATPILAYAGLSLGKDMELFKKLSWRIVPVALAVCAGTFLFATLIAQFTLRWEGVIK